MEQRSRGSRAADAPATRRWTRHRWIAAVVGLVAGVALSIGGWLIHMSDLDAAGLGPGDRTADATITDIRAATNGRSGATRWITFAFQTEDGGEHRGTAELGLSAKSYHVGSPVTVRYALTDPDHATVVGVSGVASGVFPVPWFVPLIFGVALAGGALWALRRLRWIGGVLADNPWVACPSRVFEVAGSASTRPLLRLVELRGAPDDSLVLAGPVSGRVMEDLAPNAWVAGSDRWFLVAPPGGAPPLRLKRIRLRHVDMLLRERPPHVAS